MAKKAKKTGRELTPRLAEMPSPSYKPSEARQLEMVFAKLQQLLVTEWPNINNANLGVKSGTNIVEDVLLLQLQQLALQLHTLTVNDAEAASVLVHLVAKMSQRHLQQLQVLLDILGHEELSDYLALLVPQPAAHHPCSCNKSHSTAKAASTAGSLASQSGGGTLATSHSKGTNSMGRQLQPGPDSGGTLDSSWQCRRRATGLASRSMDLDSDGSTGLAGNRSKRQTAGYTSLPDLKSLRFASLLPPGHILTKTAEVLQQEHEFEAALAASAAAKAAAAATARQLHRQAAVPMLNLSPTNIGGRPGSAGNFGSYFLNPGSRPPSGGTPVSPFKWADEDQVLGSSQPRFGALQQRSTNKSNKPWGLGGNQAAIEAESPLATSYFRAPAKSVEKLWKEGRSAVTETVLGAAHMEVLEQPMNVLVLEPTYVIQPRVVRPASPPLLDINAPATTAAGGATNSIRLGNSRRGSVTSRPCSAKRASRMSSCGIQPAAETSPLIAVPDASNGATLAAFGSTIAASFVGGSSAALTGRQELAAAGSGVGSSRSPAAAGAAAPFHRRAAIGPTTAGPGLKQGGLGINLLDAGNAGDSSSSCAPGLQLSRLGSMHAPGALQSAAVGGRPGSAASTARSRPDSAATSNLSRPTSARGHHV